MHVKISNYIEKIILQKKYIADQHVLNQYHGLFCAAALGISALAVSSLLLPNAVNAQVTAQKQVSLNNEVFVIRTENDAQGNEKIVLKNPKDVIVIPGDKLRFVIKYINNSGQNVTGFRATNPIPAAVQYVEVAEKWAQVSVDGGINWGTLEELSVQTENGETSVSRAATAADVTHVRWVLNDVIAKDASGSVSFDGIVK